jgi:Flp pilus assembly protein TadG
MRSPVKQRHDNRRSGRSFLRALLDRSGSVAVEVAFVVPMVAVIVAGTADFGMLATRTDALAGVTRIGAEYARSGASCKSGIQLLSTPNMNTACQNAIQSTMTGSMTFSPSLSFPASFPVSCECNDSPTPAAIACSASCATQSPVRPGPKRVFVTVSATQSFTPVISWPGAPSTLSSATEIRIQ